MNVTELREQAVTLLPRREALGVTMAWVNAYNKALAANLGSWCSTASAGAAQTIVIG